MPKTITLSQLGEMMSTNPHIIDIREPYEFAGYHLPGAINIPNDALLRYPERYLNPHYVYYLICDHGSVSYRAANILESYGYQAVSVMGGYKARRCLYY